MTPTTAAVGVLSGNRPTRPAHPDLTDDLWEVTKRCWNEDPQCRPDIMEVILCLRNSIDLWCDRTDVNDDEVTDEGTLESVLHEGSLIRELSFCCSSGPCTKRD
jgi:hypothetical protein